MNIAIITKESMFKLVKTYAGSVYEKDNEDYFAMAKSAEDCKFELREDKAVLRFKGVEIYPDDYEGDKEQEADEWTTATLYRKGYPNYENEICWRLSVEVDGEYIEFEAGEELMELCGMELE
nr:MAG TPA: hypothetical protein [Caudoviricetes sp.]